MNFEYFRLLLVIKRIELQNSVIFRQHFHLADGDGIEFRQPFRLRYPFADEYRIQVLQIGQAHKL